MKTIQNAELCCKNLLMHWIDLSGSTGRAKDIRLPYTFSPLQGDYKNNSVEE